MSRQQKDTVEYFPHDANASNGDTLTVLEGQFGNDGYAFWFKLLEKLASSNGHFFDTTNTKKWHLFLAHTRVNENIAVEILKLLVEMDAIDKELWEKDKIIWSQHLVDNLAPVYTNRRRNCPAKPQANTHKLLAENTGQDALTTINFSLTTADNPQSKVKYSRVNNKEKYIKRKYGEFNNVLLTDGEYPKLIERFGEQQAKDLIEKLSTYLASKGKRYKSHYATILNWQRRDKESGKAHHSRALPKTYTPTPNYPDL